jgi:transposase
MSELADQLVQREAIIAEQRATIASLTREIAQLKHYLARLTREQYGRRSEQFADTQQRLFEIEPADSDSQPATKTTVQTHQRRGGGRFKIPDHLERTIVEHDLDNKACPKCGEERARIGFEKSEQLDLIPTQLYVIEHRRLKYACKKCQEQVAIAPPPNKPIAKGLAAPGLLAAIGVGKFSEHLPLYRQEDILFRQGVNLPRSTLCRWVIESARLLQPFYELLKELVLESRTIHTDDTPVKVLDRDLPQARTGRFWVYAGDHLHPLTVYDYTPSRKRDGPREFLGDWEGYLQADAFAGYDGIYATGRVTQVSCWAHARRKFFEAKETSPRAHEALAYIQRLYAIEKELSRMSYPIAERHTIEQAVKKWYRARRDARQRYSLPILNEFQRWLKQVDALPKSPLGQAVSYLLSRWESFTRYCEKGFLDIDNNLSERLVRPVAIGRKNYLFLGADRGGEAAAVWYSLIATAKTNHVEPWAWSKALIERMTELGGLPARTNLLPLLPATWLAEHPQAQREWSR